MPFELQLEDALFLDIDGTLLDIAPKPDLVIVPPGLVETLDALRHLLRGGVAILSGRTIAQVDQFFAPLRFSAASEHGSVIRTAPEAALEQMTSPLPATLAADVTSIVARYPLVLLEVKTSALAVHFRNAPNVETELAAELGKLLAHHAGWTMMRGRRVFDIVPANVTKGRALELLRGTPTFRGRRPVMVGDDVTDLTALATAARLGGAGLTVASNVFPTEKATFANPAAVRDWLEREARRLSPTALTDMCP